MKYSVEWQDGAANAAPEERASVADLRLFLVDQNVTMHLLDGQVGDHVTLSLYGLAHGLAHDWWTIFGARDRELSLRRYRSGYLFPDIRMQFDGAAFEISAHEYAYRGPDLRFWGGLNEVLSRSEAEDQLSGLITEVLVRLDARGETRSGAALRWERVCTSRDSGERDFCEAAGAMGLDPYDLSDVAADFIERAETVFGGERLVEFVATSQEVGRARLMAWVERMSQEKGFGYRLPNLRPIIDNVEKQVAHRPAEPAWAVGYRRARAMRRMLGLAQADRLPSFGSIAARFGGGAAFALAPKVDGISALRREGLHGIHVHVRNHGDTPGATTTHAFVLARAIGDAACFPAPESAPINRLNNAYRQAAGRAFAAEFLAPTAEIMSMRNDGHDEYSIAAELGVDRMVIVRQIENRDRIEGACA